MQRNLAICIMGGCNVTEQALATTVAQDDICEGIPTPSRSWEIIQCVAVISAITFPIIALRFLSRYLISKRLWWDDWMIVLCAVGTSSREKNAQSDFVPQVLLVPMAVIPILNATRGFGKHFYNIPPQNITSLRELYYVSQIFYTLVHPIAKVSILLLYLRIFPNKTFQLITRFCIGFMAIHILVFFFVVVFQCVPVKSIWDTSIKGKCLNLNVVIYTGSAVSIVEDVVIILLPIPQLMALNFTGRKKWALGFMFSLGSFACITSMVRLKYIVEFNRSIDLTWDDVDLTLWSIIEVYVAVICSCLISLRPLIMKYIPELLSTTNLFRTPTLTSTPPSTRRRMSWWPRMTVQLPWDNGAVFGGESLRGWEDNLDKPLPRLPMVGPIRKTTEMHVVSMRVEEIEGDEMKGGEMIGASKVTEPERTWSIELGLGSPRPSKTSMSPKSPIPWV
ncbi:uncharacterized protein PAC_00003 [Phialocephala subalpina]|uniref:Rhodopsin domain-containing protein n=1 Tax=Phialocephala subalpina TaxID=576137 RepID=A0A1L7WBG2_9HELO|nr:uncharacterized protein PAC_00003 [Phialocephala subalpina]